MRQAAGLLTCLMLSGCALGATHLVCTYVAAPAARSTVEGGNELVAYREEAPLPKVAGRVRFSNGEAVPGALLELFRSEASHCAVGAMLTGPWPLSSERILATVSGADGAFCMPSTPEGCYELRASFTPDVNVTHAYIRISPNARSKRIINVVLSLGT